MSASKHPFVLVLGAGLATLVFVPLLAPAGQVASVPTFSAGQPIRASDFNSAFTSFRDEINDNDTRIGNLGQLQTSAKNSLVDALNEVRQNAGAQGAQGAQGPQGPAGPTRVFIRGGGTLQDSDSLPKTATTFGSNGSLPLPRPSPAGAAVVVSGTIQHFRATSATPTYAPGVPDTNGTVALEARWSFSSGVNTVTVVLGTANVTIDSAGAKNFTISGTIPSPPGQGGTPAFPTGDETVLFESIEFRVLSSTVVSGQAFSQNNYATIRPVCTLTVP